MHPQRPEGLPRRERIAVVGSGIAGLSAAYVLSGRHEVTLLEAQDRLGGHAHTHTVPVGAVAGSRDGERTVAVDSGFIVHNDRTYPLLRRLFGELGVQARPTEMSMSIRHESSGLEYAGGRGLRGFLASPRHLADRDYLRMLASVRRFHGVARRFLAATDDTDRTTFGELVEDAGFPRAFVELYAVPLVACVWSSGPGDTLGYPARYLLRFLEHHGMLSIGDSPQWLTVVGGSATYVEAVAARLAHVRRGVGVTSIARDEDGVSISTSAGRDRFDRVVIATHADEALALLADPSPAEKEVLGAFRYTRNETVLHRDASLLPRARAARASWNYLVPAEGAGSGGDGRSAEGAGSAGGAGSVGARPPVVTYWMNRLQGLPTTSPLLVTLNGGDRVDPATVVATMSYTHPIYDLDAVTAARRLPELSGGRTAYAGAYHGWGFHEDGCRSGVAAAAALGVTW